MHQLNNGYDQYQTYTIDWRHDKLTWLINDVAVRIVYKFNSTSPMTPPEERWFPSTPSQIQISIWGGGDSPDWGTSDWSGGPIHWGSNQQYFATYNNLSIQCYDDEDNPVSSWPNTFETVSITYPASDRLWSGSELDSVLSNGSINKIFNIGSLPRPNSSSSISLIIIVWIMFIVSSFK